MDKISKKQVEGKSQKTVRKVNNPASPPKNAPAKKKKPHKLTRAEYYDLGQIDLPFDTYSI